MNRTGIRLVTLGSTLGAVGGIYLYGVLSAGPTPAAPPVLTSVHASVQPAAATATRYADCVAPAVLEGEECVTHVEQVVAQPAEPGSGSGGSGSAVTPRSGTPRAASAPTAVVRAPARASGESDEHESEHEGEHGTERHSDD